MPRFRRRKDHHNKDNKTQVPEAAVSLSSPTQSQQQQQTASLTTQNEQLKSQVTALEESRVADLEELQELRTQVAQLKVICEQGGAGFPPRNKENKHGDQDEDGNNNEDEETGICSGLIGKVNHFAIIVSDAEASKAFYVGVLGAKIVNRPNFPSPGYWLWLGNIQLHLIQGTHANVEASHAAGVATGHVNHLSLEVHDFDAVETALKRHGVQYTKNLVPADNQSVIHQLFLPDPDGHYIEICDCHLFNDFVFGKERNEARASRLAASYLEGADLLGTTVAAAYAISFAPERMSSIKRQDDFNSHFGNLHRAFKLISGGKESIKVDDWQQFLKRMGHANVTREEVAGLLEPMDHDQSGGLSFLEFSDMMLLRMKPENTVDEMRKAFSMMDRNHDGKIDKDDLLLMLWSMGQRMDETQLANAIAKADDDGDGTINVEEFLHYFHAEDMMNADNNGGSEAAMTNIIEEEY